MSGGVDSSVSAALLKEQGFHVHGVFMHNWDTRDERGTCPSDVDYMDAKKICDKLDIKLSRVDYTREYWTWVFDPFLDGIADGNTPNPDIACNQYIKFGAFARQFLGSGEVRRGTNMTLKPPIESDWIATGHYVRTRVSDKGQSVQLLKATDPGKDQTYFLSTVSSKVLARSLFPVGSLLKSEVKEIARKMGLHVASKHENEYVEQVPGDFITVEGEILPQKHKGMARYTVGQCARLSGKDVKWYVAEKRIKDNQIIVVPGK
ncbi:hypothetical protein HDU76_003114 [Blyttiomyces sp. JEL0837]|nr:hypothetical protein HDU76_003114 [Blyttiomyces sp. JEL0837]